MAKAMAKQIKQFYIGRSEKNWIKSYQLSYILRRCFSRTMWAVTASPVKDASWVLDAGCGDGVWSVLLALWHPQQRIVAMDIAEEGVRAAREAAEAHGVSDRIMFVVGDAERLPSRGGGEGVKQPLRLQQS